MDFRCAPQLAANEAGAILHGTEPAYRDAPMSCFSLGSPGKNWWMRAAADEYGHRLETPKKLEDFSKVVDQLLISYI